MSDRNKKLVFIGLLVGWTAIMTQVGRDFLYPLLGGYAALTSAIVLGIEPRVRGLLRGPPRDVIMGLVTGVVMISATYLAFDATAYLLPTVIADVERNYATTGIGGNWGVAPYMVLIVVAEEILWRGALFGAFRGARAPWDGAAVALTTYVLAQVPTGTWVIVALAVVCGVVWTAQRVWTKGLVAPLITHLMWTTTIMIIHPVVGR